MYSQGLDCGPLRMLGALCRGRSELEKGSWRSGGWPQFRGCAVVATHQARTAIAVVLRDWGIGPGDEVLVPAYNCGTDIDPVIKSGASVRPYRIAADLQLDMADIRRLVTPRTRVIYVIHYFGWPQKLAELRRYCDGAGIKLLEDCALTLFSRGGGAGTWLGQQGDAAVFSLPKTLAVPDGGILLLGQPLESVSLPNRRPSLRKTIRKLLPLGKRFLLRRTAGMGLYKVLDRRRSPAAQSSPDGGVQRPDIPASYYFNPATTNWNMSRVTQGLLRYVQPEEIVKRRRHNYLRLLDVIRGLPGIQPVFEDLPAGVCPLGLPVLVQRRRTWVRQLSARHIDVYAWWSGYHTDIDWDAFPEACRLKDQVLLLPIHQQLDDRHVDYIGREVAALARTQAALDMSEPSAPTLGPVRAA